MTPQDEEWRAVVGYGGRYEVSDQGRVRSLEFSVTLPTGGTHVYPPALKTLTPNESGYLRTGLRYNAERAKSYVHHLVAAAFIGPCPDGMQVCHNNGDCTDNRATNLRYDTPSANQFDRVRHGTHHNANKTACKRGHAFSPENTRNIGGRRSCLTCEQIRGTANYQKRQLRNSQAA